MHISVNNIILKDLTLTTGQRNSYFLQTVDRGTLGQPVDRGALESIFEDYVVTRNF